MSNVTVSITNGPSIDVTWFSGMNAQQAMEGAFNQQSKSDNFTYAIQYFGTSLGYLVVMIDEIYETSTAPYFYWEFFVNGKASMLGIDSVTLESGDTVTFTYETYDEIKHKDTTVGAKNSFYMRSIIR